MKSRHAVITGAGRGIGAAIARGLAAQGATLTLMGRRLEPLQALASELAGGAVAVPVDVGDEAAVQRAASIALIPSQTLPSYRLPSAHDRPPRTPTRRDHRPRGF